MISNPEIELKDTGKDGRERITEIRFAYEMRRESLYQEYIQVAELWDYLAGGVAKEDKTYLDTMGRIARSFNIILPQIITVQGNRISTKTKLKCYAQEPGDVKMADVHSANLQYAIRETNGENEYKYVVSDAIVGRRGWMSLGWERTGRWPDGHLIWRRLNPFDVLFDVDSSEMDLNRGKNIIYTRFYTADRIIQLYAQNNPDLVSRIDRRASELEGWDTRIRRKKSQAQMYREESSAPYLWQFSRDRKEGTSRAFPHGAATDYFNPSKGLYRVIEYHEKRYADRKFIVDPKYGTLLPIPEEYENKTEVIAQVLMEMGLDGSAVQTLTIPEYWVTVVAPGLLDDYVLMERPYTVQSSQDDYGFAIKGMGCYDFDPDKGKWLGIVDVLKDPQDTLNRRISTRDDMITRFINPHLVAKAESLGRFAKDWMSRKPGLRLLWEKGDRPPEFVYPPPHVINLLDSESEFMMGFAQRITGVSPNLQGFKETSNESGVLFENKVRSGWRDRVPAVVHIDGTARVQTVSAKDEPRLAELLERQWVILHPTFHPLS